mmetsp:Transcript_1361/g.1852  ORF Transcript_1361/g.1852 Transcript_1361/m.1852 type:complete len:227 (+) Transcript_1361:481-1161(+)
MTKYDRSKLQQNQMKRWTQEQMYERAYQKRIEKEEDMAYAEMIKAVDSIRENNENEEQELARYSRQATKEQNAELARIQRERQDQAKAERNDPLTKTSLDLFNEDTTTAMDSTGKVLRRDMFKGFTMEQRRKIQQENEDVLQEHRMRKEKDLSEEYDWMLQQSMTLKAMEQSEYEERQMRDLAKEEHLRILRDQIAEQAKMKEDWRKTKNGAIEKGFFEGFGKSGR